MFESEFEQNLYALRRDKLKQIAALGQEAGLNEAQATYPNSYSTSHTIPELRAAYDPLSTEELEAAPTPITARIAGRIMAIRVQGKAGFAQLQQGGQRMQIYVRKDDVGENAFALYKLLDLGDHIGVIGHLFRTRTGELTIHVSKLTFLSKALLALPDKFHGLADTELRYRQRYVDLFMNVGTLKPATPPPPPTEAAEAAAIPNETVILSEARSAQPKDPEAAGPATTTSPLSATDVPATEPETRNVREVFVKRAAILRAIRAFFDGRGYLEVETPMMQQIAGGAAARPFTTHHNELDIDLFLRIAPELYLKRLVVGGLDRVYEINRNFRNEGVSTRHNPEFTMLEFYQAYANYHDLMRLTEELIIDVARQVNGTTITHFNGNEIDLCKWTRLTMREAILHFWPEAAGDKPDPSIFADKDATVALVHRLRAAKIAIEYSPAEPLGKTIATIFETVAEPHLIQPTIIYDFPLAVSPLSKIKPDEPDWVERFEFYIGGFEVGNAFSELNDPEDQRQRFLDQLDQKEKGDDEAHQMDEDYVRALGYGLPPTAGEGIGIDRLTMLLTNSRSIRDVILFPLMRPIQKSPDQVAAKQNQPHGESAE
ncbi:lysyl-tRNA synthetase class 2 [Edaphobacter aggregans]|uniref:Lysine--tRNA ligase n=1 Tax=Edaphobacter aggregans TaxID=570835 RepID=A0A428MR24_9BACT|nr:lysine--tRNA ligase [Edaphobacter aggregans]RSL19352.1 lysyl-tRNA synthetase class 2 [Edaphobacter aggregans]